MDALDKWLLIIDESEEYVLNELAFLFKVRFATSLEKSVRILETIAFDLVIIHDTEIDFTHFKKIERIAAPRKVPIIILTDKTSISAYTGAFTLKDFVFKPYTIQEVLIRIENLITRKSNESLVNMKNNLN